MYQIVKRLFDILLSGMVLILLSPLFLMVIILLKITGEGEVFYYQQRIGYKCRYFNILKFATMLKDSPNMGTGLITLRNDPRLLPMGGLLRKTKINELPQIVNILKGDISIVGPRPLAEKTYDSYPVHVKKKVYNIKPGLTGIGSIVFRDEERLLSETELPPQTFYELYIAPYKGELELWYQRNIGLYTDMMLVFLTAWTIISPQNELVYHIFKDLPERPKELK
jgi:lipopolysaccharide/colanic/teichoic acid biosynthesis glycosyltransferase